MAERGRKGWEDWNGFDTTNKVVTYKSGGACLVAAKWFVLQSKPNKEEFLWGQLLARQIEAFCPRIRYKAANPRSRESRPFFPGYLFIRVDPALVSMLNLNWIPGVQNLVSFGGEPACVPDGLVQAIRRRVEEINESSGELRNDPKQRSIFPIESRPPSSYEGIFDHRLPSSERTSILFTLLNENPRIPVGLPVG